MILRTDTILVNVNNNLKFLYKQNGKEKVDKSIYVNKLRFCLLYLKY